VDDVLVLTKSLGTGLLATAMKQERLDESGRDALYSSMRSLNATASRAALGVGVRCATDVTGFGLLGHASHVARASGVTLRIRGASLAELPRARALWRDGIRTGGAERNEDFVGPMADWHAADPADVALALDPQTSGGLLLAVPPARVEEYLSAVPGSAVIGSVTGRTNVLLVVE
jgi:selenide,water dikinase